MLNRLKLRAVGLILAVFAVGTLAGMTVTTTVADMNEPREREDRSRPSYTDRLTAELSLDAEQRESVAVILERRNQAMRGIWEDMRPQFDSLRQQIRSEIGALLSDDQQAAFDELTQRSDSARAARRGGER